MLSNDGMINDTLLSNDPRDGRRSHLRLQGLGAETSVCGRLERDPDSTKLKKIKMDPDSMKLNKINSSPKSETLEEIAVFLGCTYFGIVCISSIEPLGSLQRWTPQTNLC